MQNYKCTICFRNIKTKSSKILLNEKFVTKCKCKYYYHERCIKIWMKIKKHVQYVEKLFLIINMICIKF